MHDTFTHRTPPSDTTAEMCVIASLLCVKDDKELAAQIVEGLTPDSFYDIANGMLFKVITECRKHGRPLDSVLLRGELDRRKLLEEVGGVAYLAQLLNTVPSAAHGPHYANIVRRCHQLRTLEHVANDTVRRAYMPDADPGDIAQRAIDSLANVSAAGRGHRIIKLEDALLEVFEQATSGGVPLTPTPFGQLNEWLGGGVANGEYVIVAGWPSHGKSALAKRITEHWAGAQHEPGVFIALEESAAKVARNILSAQSGVLNKSIRSGNLSKNDNAALAEAIAALSGEPFWLCETCNTLADVCTVIDIAAARHGAKWAVVDHADLIDLSGIHGDGETAKHTQLSRTLKMLAKRLNLKLVLVKQLTKPDHIRKPLPRDLRQSGAYWQDADVILFVDSDAVHNRGNPEWQPNAGKPADVTDLICAKSREGTGGTAWLRWDGKTQRYEEAGGLNTPDPFA